MSAGTNWDDEGRAESDQVVRSGEGVRIQSRDATNEDRKILASLKARYAHMTKSHAAKASR